MSRAASLPRGARRNDSPTAAGTRRQLYSSAGILTRLAAKRNDENLHLSPASCKRKASAARAQRATGQLIHASTFVWTCTTARTSAPVPMVSRSPSTATRVRRLLACRRRWRRLGAGRRSGRNWAVRAARRSRREQANWSRRRRSRRWAAKVSCASRYANKSPHEMQIGRRQSRPPAPPCSIDRQPAPAEVARLFSPERPTAKEEIICDAGLFQLSGAARRLSYARGAQFDVLIAWLRRAQEEGGGDKISAGGLSIVSAALATAQHDATKRVSLLLSSAPRRSNCGRAASPD